MAGRKSTAPIVNLDHVLNVGGFTLTAAELAAMTVPEWDGSSRMVPLMVEETRVRVATTVAGKTGLPEYRVMLSIVREPVSEQECATVDAHEVATKGKQQQRKAEDEASKKALIEAVKREAKADAADAFGTAAKVVGEVQKGLAALNAMGISSHPLAAVVQATGNGHA